MLEQHRITGAELSLSGQGKINSNLTINLIAGYTYMNPISLELDYVYGEDYYEKPLTYRSSGSDSTMLKYRYKHIAKTDIEIVYKDISIGGSMRYNSFMKNIDKIFTSQSSSLDRYFRHQSSKREIQRWRPYY